MSQYQDSIFFERNLNDEFSMLQSPRLIEKNLFEINFLPQKKFQNQFPQTNDFHCTTEISSFIEKSNSQPLQSSFINAKSTKQNIHVNQESKIKRKQTFKGLKDDTTVLNTNFKTIIYKKLKQFITLKEIDASEKDIIQLFNKTGPSFEGIKILVNSQNLKKKGLKLTKSERFVKQILRSNIKMQNKMTMLKYIECLKQNFECKDVIKWKQIGNQ